MGQMQLLMPKQYMLAKYNKTVTLIMPELLFAFSALTMLLDGRKGIQPVKTEC